MTKLIVNEINAIEEAVALSEEGIEIRVGSTDKTVLLFTAGTDAEITVKAGSTVLGSTSDLELSVPSGTSALNIDGKFAAGDTVIITGPSSVTVQTIVLP